MVIRWRCWSGIRWFSDGRWRGGRLHGFGYLWNRVSDCGRLGSSSFSWRRVSRFRRCFFRSHECWRWRDGRGKRYS